MALRRATPFVLAGMLIPAAWGVSQQPPRATSAPPPRPQQQEARPFGRFATPAQGDNRTGSPAGSFGMQGRRPMGPPSNEMRGKFPPFFDELAKMSPEDRNKALEGRTQFQRMPPWRREQLREQLERFSNMTPEQRQMMRDRFTIMQSMAPENRDRIREVFPRWRKLPEERQQAMREEFRALSEKSAVDREKRFADPEFQKAFSPQEQKLLKDLSGLIK